MNSIWTFIFLDESVKSSYPMPRNQKRALVIAHEWSVLPPERAADTRPLKPWQSVSTRLSHCFSSQRLLKVLSPQKRRERLDNGSLCDCAVVFMRAAAGARWVYLTIHISAAVKRRLFGVKHGVMTSHFCSVSAYSRNVCLCLWWNWLHKCWLL